MAYMKHRVLTVRLDSSMDKNLERVCKRLRSGRSEVTRQALRRFLAVEEFRQLRQELSPLAEAKGVLTDEDVFHIVS